MESEAYDSNVDAEPGLAGASVLRCVVDDDVEQRLIVLDARDREGHPDRGVVRRQRAANFGIDLGWQCLRAIDAVGGLAELCFELRGNLCLEIIRRHLSRSACGGAEHQCDRDDGERTTCEHESPFGIEGKRKLPVVSFDPTESLTGRV